MISKKFPSPLLTSAFILLCSQLLLAACTTTDSVKHGAYQKPIAPGAGVLLMKPDIECSKVTASGMIEPNAAWTAQCQRSVQFALIQFMRDHQAELIVYDPSQLPSDKIPRYRELSKLYEAVGGSILMRSAFPTAKSKTDWTMGKGVQVMREDHDADYVLFIFLRDQYETGGRTAMRLAVAVLGVMTMPATQQGFASLVDLESGDIVWFNHLFSTVGDLREPESARDAIDALLEGSPVL
jgi:hypothetical protein